MDIHIEDNGCIHDMYVCKCLRWQSMSIQMPNDATKTSRPHGPCKWDAKSYNASFISGPRPSPAPSCPIPLDAPPPPTVAAPTAARWSCGGGGSRGGSVRAMCSRVRSAPLAPAPRPRGSPSICTAHNTQTNTEGEEAEGGSSEHMDTAAGSFETRLLWGPFPSREGKYR